MSSTLRIVGGLAIFVVSLTVFASVSVRANDSDVTSTTLKPGLNYIGWVGEPLAASSLFRQIPSANLIYTWDAASRSYRHAVRDMGGSLETVEPGMALRIHVDGRRSVQWERSSVPAKGSVTLYKGVNWVSWLGRDKWPLDQVARGIGTSLISIRVGDRTWPAPFDDSVDDLPTLRRGDAVEVTVSRDSLWLQPTGILPKILFLGDPPQDVRDKFTVDARRVLDLFADVFAIETDFSDTTLLMFYTVEAALEHEASGEHPHIGAQPGWLRNKLLNSSQTSVFPWGVHMTLCPWDVRQAESCNARGITTFLHEWFHVIQYQFGAARWNAPRVTTAWIEEGAAMWAEWLLPDDLREVPYQEDRQTRIDQAARSSVTLKSVEQHNHHWAYRLGPLASEQLAELSNPEAHIEYLRRFQPQLTGRGRHWVTTPTWQEAFEGAFGLTPSAFYRSFEAWRATLPVPDVRYDYEQGDVPLTGTIRYRDGTAATGLQVFATPVRDGFSIGIERNTLVDDEGFFSIEVAPRTLQRITVRHDGCTLQLTHDGLSAGWVKDGQHRDLDPGNLPELALVVSEGACGQDPDVRISLLRLRNDERRIEISLNSEDGQQWISAQASGADSYSVSVPEDGRYRIRVLVGGCHLWYHHGGLVASQQDAALLELSETTVSIESRIPADLCLRTISGRLVREDSSPIPQATIFAVRGAASGHALSDADGDFNITVPDSGSYTLHFTHDGCLISHASSGATSDWRSATPFEVDDEDVEGIEFVLPNDPASVCN